MADDGKQYLSLEEVAERLGVHYQLIYRLVRSGELPAIRLGRIYRVEAADLDAFLQAAKRHVHAEDMTGESCGACGRVFRSRQALRQACETCGQPLCMDCWVRLGRRVCREHREGVSGAAPTGAPPEQNA